MHVPDIDERPSSIATRTGERMAKFVPVVATLPAFLAAAAVALFTLGLACQRVYEAGRDLLQGDLSTTTLKSEFLGLVSLTLTSVVFYLIAVGMVELFVSPKFKVLGAHVKSLNDLEMKVLNVIIVVLATTFLERFIAAKDGNEIMKLGAAMAIAIAAIIAFQLLLRAQDKDKAEKGEAD